MDPAPPTSSGSEPDEGGGHLGVAGVGRRHDLHDLDRGVADEVLE